MTKTMRVIRQDTFGGPEVLKLAQAEIPEPGPTEILVRVHAAGVNPADWKLRRGDYAAGYQPPLTPGWEVSGVVEAVAPGVTRFVPGDEVFGMLKFPALPGGYGEYLTAPARHFALKPPGLSHTEAAALPLAALTAWQSLVDTASVQPGQRVLVHAAGGGVGHLAVQIAKARGAYVIGTARATKHELLRELGADQLIDYTTGDFGTLSDIDVVLDPIGGDYGKRSLAVIKPGGTYITIVEYYDLTPLEAEHVQVKGVLVEPDYAGLEQIVTLVGKGQLRPVIAQAFPLEQADRAHELGQSNRTTGKIVLTTV